MTNKITKKLIKKEEQQLEKVMAKAGIKYPTAQYIPESKYILDEPAYVIVEGFVYSPKRGFYELTPDADKNCEQAILARKWANENVDLIKRFFINCDAIYNYANIGA